MFEITKYASSKLLKILSDNLHVSSGYGVPPIFYWYRNVIEKSREIENCQNLRRGDYKYRLGLSLGVAHIKCDYIGRKRIVLITDYDINTNMLFSWYRQSGEGGLIPKSKEKQKSKGYHIITTKPLFGYKYVMNDKKEYNLIDANGKLLTQWFKNIQPLTKPYGKYQIIAYINVGGYLCGLGYNGKVYNMNKAWNDAHLNECINILCDDIFKNLQHQYLNESKDGVVQINEQQLRSIIKEITQYLAA